MPTPDTAAAQWRHTALNDTVVPSTQGTHVPRHDQIDRSRCPEALESTIPESTVLAAVTMLRCAEDLCESARKLLSPFSSDAANQAGAARDAAVAASNVADGLNWN